jgi:hypothetical protein
VPYKAPFTWLTVSVGQVIQEWLGRGLCLWDCPVRYQSGLWSHAKAGLGLIANELVLEAGSLSPITTHFSTKWVDSLQVMSVAFSWNMAFSWQSMRRQTHQCPSPLALDVTNHHLSCLLMQLGSTGVSNTIRGCLGCCLLPDIWSWNWDLLHSDFSQPHCSICSSVKWSAVIPCYPQIPNPTNNPQVPHMKWHSICREPMYIFLCPFILK